VATNTAQIAAMVAEVITTLSPAQLKRLKNRSTDFADVVTALSRDEQAKDRIKIPASDKVEVSKGTGFGELLDSEEGQRRLAAFVTPAPLEEWAGPVMGASALLRDFGIARSTLHDWQKRGEVVGLLKGACKPVFPL